MNCNKIKLLSAVKFDLRNIYGRMPAVNSCIIEVTYNLKYYILLEKIILNQASMYTLWAKVAPQLNVLHNEMLSGSLLTQLLLNLPQHHLHINECNSLCSLH